MVPSGSVGWLQSFGTHTFGAHGCSQAGSRVTTATLQKLSGSPSAATHTSQRWPLASIASSAAIWPSRVSTSHRSSPDVRSDAYVATLLLVAAGVLLVRSV
jgi:hypothetical protein